MNLILPNGTFPELRYTRFHPPRAEFQASHVASMGSVKFIKKKAVQTKLVDSIHSLDCQCNAWTVGSTLDLTSTDTSCSSCWCGVCYMDPKLYSSRSELSLILTSFNTFSPTSLQYSCCDDKTYHHGIQVSR